MKIKLLIQVVTISCLGLGSTSYGSISCTALRTSQAYEEGIITENRLQELYDLWKDGLNASLKKRHNTEDPIASYEDFKIMFGLWKKRVQVACFTDNEVHCDEQLQQIAESTGEAVKVAKRTLNMDYGLFELFLENTENSFNGIIWAWLNYVYCDGDLERVISKFSLALQNPKKWDL